MLQLLVKAPKDFAFPSGHTQASFAAAASICMWKRKWGIPALILASLVAFSRMYLYVHYPTDVLGGLFYGVAYALIALAICNKLFRNKPWDGCEGAKKRRRKRRPQTQQAQQPQHDALITIPFRPVLMLSRTAFCFLPPQTQYEMPDFTEFAKSLSEFLIDNT